MNRPLHIGLVVYDGLDSISGGYLYDRKLVDRLRQRGARVSVFTLPRRAYPFQLTDNLRSGLERQIRRADLDILLEDELNHPSLAWLNGRLRQIVHGPIVSIVHHLRSSEQHPTWLLSGYAAVERQYLSGVDAFVFNSQTTAQSVRSLSGHDQPSVVAFPAGDRFGACAVTASEIASRARTPGSLRVVHLGNVIPRKGLHTLLLALASLPRGAMTLHVIGSLTVSPVFTRAMRRLVQKLQLQDEVRFLGQCTDAAMRQILRQAHVLAIPSSYEGFGIAYLEGMSFGLPAIGTTAGAAREIITDGQAGFLVAPGQPRELAQRLLLFCENRTMLEHMGQAALQRAQHQPGWDESMNHAARFIETLAYHQGERAEPCPR